MSREIQIIIILIVSLFLWGISDAIRDQVDKDDSKNKRLKMAFKWLRFGMIISHSLWCFMVGKFYSWDWGAYVFIYVSFRYALFDVFYNLAASLPWNFVGSTTPVYSYFIKRIKNTGGLYLITKILALLLGLLVLIIK